MALPANVGGVYRLLILSIGVVFIIGKFRLLDLSDLEAHFNCDLVCPNTLIGAASEFVSSVRG
jgi:hypothetical protein